MIFSFIIVFLRKTFYVCLIVLCLLESTKKVKQVGFSLIRPHIVKLYTSTVWHRLSNMKNKLNKSWMVSTRSERNALPPICRYKGNVNASTIVDRQTTEHPTKEIQEMQITSRDEIAHNRRVSLLIRNRSLRVTSMQAKKSGPVGGDALMVQVCLEKARSPLCVLMR